MERDKSLSLYLKYRPQTLDEIIGNEATVASLRSIIGRESGEARSFLFTGPSRCGKTTLARIIGNELNCSKRDFMEYNSANVRGIDTIREIGDDCKYAPMEGKVKIYLLDEIHRATVDAQNALLKLLEDTPEHVRFILCTTDPEKLIPTVRKRCTTYLMLPLKRNQIMRLLKCVCKEEEVDVPDSILMKIITYCDGAPGEALVMLDQVIDLKDEEIALQVIINASVDEKTVLELCQLLLTGTKWKSVSEIIKTLDEEPEKVRLAINGYMSKVLLSSGGEKAAKIMELFKDPFYTGGKPSLILACYWATML